MRPIGQMIVRGGAGGGSSPKAGPLAAAGHAGPSPRPVAQRAPGSRSRQRGNVDVDARLTGGSRVLAWETGLAGSLLIAWGVFAGRSPRPGAGTGLLICWRPAMRRGPG